MPGLGTGLAGIWSKPVPALMACVLPVCAWFRFSRKMVMIVSLH
jgi:hypothetical protein